MQTEHKAVSDVFRALEKQGFDVTWLAPQANGLLRLSDLENAIRPDTQLVSIMHVNNETGVIQDIASIGAHCRAADVLLHVDAAQSAGKLPLDLASLPVDLLSATAHKLYGPKGIGVLYIDRRPGCQLDPLFFGGGQQQRLRPGTLPVALIAGFGLAAELACRTMDDDHAHAQALRTQLWQAIENLSGLLLNGDPEHSYPGILNVSAAGIDGESLLLDLEPLCVATGSACNAQNRDPSAVLRALGRTDEQAQSAIRFSFGRATTVADIEQAARLYRNAVKRLRALAPPAAA
jgi:cysteine desulfurase